MERLCTKLRENAEPQLRMSRRLTNTRACDKAGRGSTSCANSVCCCAKHSCVGGGRSRGVCLLGVHELALPLRRLLATSVFAF